VPIYSIQAKTTILKGDIMGIYLYTVKKSNPIKTRHGLTVHKCKWHRRSLIHDWDDSSCKTNQLKAIDAIERAWSKAGTLPCLQAPIDENGKLEAYEGYAGGVPVSCSTQTSYEDSGSRDPHFVGLLFKVLNRWEIFFMTEREACALKSPPKWGG